MKLKCAKYCIPISLLPVLCLTSPSLAQGIRILDCNGQTRAVHQISTALAYTVSVKVVDRDGVAKGDSELTLTNKSGKFTALTSAEGIAEFANIEPGVWLVGGNQTGLYYSSITLSDTYRGGFWDSVGNVASDVLGVAAVAGVAVGVGILIDDATDGSGGGGDAGGGDSGGMPGGECTSCNPDAAAPSVPGFRQR